MVGLATNEAVELLKAAVGRPTVKRSHWAGFPDGDFVTFAHICRAVAVHPQCGGEGGHAVWAQGVIAWRGGGDFGNAAHTDAVMIAPG